MSRQFATGKRAWGTCDRCGWRYYLHELREEVEDQRFNGLLVCDMCFDPDHPQLRLGEIDVTDPEALFNPRPDVNKPGSTNIFGWRPVGNPLTGELKTEIGTVTVT